jgi:hypothetical protein
MTEDEIIDGVRRWIREIVIGLRLCPFARAPFEAGTIAYLVTRAGAEEALYGELLGALETFLQADPAEVSTALLICPDALTDFSEYDRFLAMIEEGLSETGLDRLVQIAGFHPRYHFAHAPPEDAADYTNRSPWPLFHFLRQDEVSSALAVHPDPDGIPVRNIALLRRMGIEQIKRRLSEIRDGRRPDP